MSTSEDDQWVVQPGTDVYGSDGTMVGSVDTIAGEHFVLRKDASSARALTVPFSAVAGHTNDRIDLNVSSDQARNEDWDATTTGTTTTASSDTGTTRTSSDSTVPAGATSSDAGAARRTRSETTAPQDEVDKTPFEHRTGGVAHSEDDEAIYIPVVEEELTATKRGVERGAVRVETNVSEREETLSVPVTEERIHVERVAVDRDATAEDLNRDGATIDVPVYGEEVDMQKRARVVEEVEISKDAVQETRQVSGTVRREDVEVIDETGTNPGTTSGTSRRRQ